MMTAFDVHFTYSFVYMDESLYSDAIHYRSAKDTQVLRTVLRRKISKFEFATWLKLCTNQVASPSSDGRPEENELRALWRVLPGRRGSFPRSSFPSSDYVPVVQPCSVDLHNRYLFPEELEIVLKAPQRRLGVL